jgi:Ca2+:H+ antiporter
LTRLERALLAAVVVITVAAGLTRYLHGVSHTAAFAVAALALAGLAWLVSFSTEQVGGRFGAPVTGLLQATVGNLPEFFVVLFALRAGELVVAQTAIVGSILVNALLVLGLVIVAGAARAPGGMMRFNPRLPNDTTTLLLSSTLIIVVIALTQVSHDAASRHAKTMSIVGAGVLLALYGSWLFRYLRSGEAGQHRAEPPRLSTGLGLVLLVAGGTASAFVSDWFIHALEPTIRSLHISRAFAGLVIVAIAGNAVEHATGVVLAAKGQYELAIAVVKSSVSQLSAFLFPLMVLVSLTTATTLTFALAPVYAGALFGAAVLVWQVTGDGEAPVWEGLALISAYIVLAVVAGFEA